MVDMAWTIAAFLFLLFIGLCIAGTILTVVGGMILQCVDEIAGWWK